MYICKECKTEYKEKVEYCDCGNNTFDYVEDKKTFAAKNTQDKVSIIFFIVCVILSIIVWAIPVKTTHTPKTEPKKQQTVSNIPDIEKIWQEAKVVEPQPAAVQPTVPTAVENARQN